MATPAEALSIVLDHLDAGRIGPAEVLVARVLDAIPDHPDALHIAGVVAGRAGRLADSLDLLSRALLARPGAGDIRANLRAAAEAAWDAARRAGDVEAMVRASGILRDLAPADPNFRFRHALALGDAGRSAESADEYRALARIAPATGAVWHNLGTTLLALGREEEADRAFRRRAALDPGAGEVWRDSAPAAPDVRGQVSRLARASRFGLGSAFDWHRAAQRFLELRFETTRAATAIDPTDARVWNNLGSLWSRRGERERALAAHVRAATIDPGEPKYAFNRGVARLARGDLGGWSDYARGCGAVEARPAERPAHLPRWDGGPLSGPLLVTREQGVGDEIFFAGMLPDLLARGIRVIWERDPRLAPLFERSFPEVVWVDEGVGADEAVARIAAGDLPGPLRPDHSAFARTVAPFLRADPEAIGRARRRHDPGDGRPRIGVSWFSTNRDYGADRSARARDLSAAIARAGAARVVNLQYGDTHADLAEARAAGFDIAVDPEVDTWSDLDGLAALIASLDLVISIDNSTVHLAGALGVPVWILLPPGSDWRWFVDPERSPWYPSARLFRRRWGEDWAEPLARVTASLAAFRAEGRKPAREG